MIHDKNEKYMRVTHTAHKRRNISRARSKYSFLRVHFFIRVETGPRVVRGVQKRGMKSMIGKDTSPLQAAHTSIGIIVDSWKRKE